MTDPIYTVDALFAGKDQAVRDTYNQLLDVLRELGPLNEEPKKTSIHLSKKTGFAGVHPRKSYLYLNLRTEHPIDSPRVSKVEQVSKNRYHNEIKLVSPEEIDQQLTGWLKEAYALGV
jgi:Domain of unknown function (DUF5655)